MVHKHPKVDFYDQLQRPAASAKALGYRMPAEFEPLDAVWLTFPHNDETWPGCLERAQTQYEGFIEAVRRFARAEVLGRDRMIPTDDSWIRDYGPIFVIDDRGNLACHDFIFNSWGEKYGPWEKDNVVPQHVARELNLPIWVHDLVLEGGSIEVNGRGTVMTTEQCLLNENRNPHLSRPEIEERLHEALGTRHVIWLPGGIAGDDTDGHIDDIARFVAPDRVVALRASADHPDHGVLEANWQALEAAADQDGKKLELLPLPVPEPVYYDFPPDRFSAGGRNPVPASYANFLIVNDGVLVPIFGQEADDTALRAVERAMPGKQVVGVRAEFLVVGLGALHCLSQQQPRRADGR